MVVFHSGYRFALFRCPTPSSPCTHSIFKQRYRRKEERAYINSMGPKRKPQCFSYPSKITFSIYFATLYHATPTHGSAASRTKTSIKFVCTIVQWYRSTAAPLLANIVENCAHLFDRPGRRRTVRKKPEGLLSGRRRGNPGRHHADDFERDCHDGRGVWMGVGKCMHFAPHISFRQALQFTLMVAGEE